MDAQDARWACPGATGHLDAQRTTVVRFPQLLTREEVEQIRGLADEVEALDTSAVLDFSKDPETAHRGAWKTVYLQSGAFRDRLPDTIRQKLTDAVAQADKAQRWRLLDCEHGVRNAEVHAVGTGGCLPEPTHHDTGSLITLDVMLSSAEEFDGGEFRTLQTGGKMKDYEFEQGDAMVFCSYKFHCVSPVTRGTRRVFIKLLS